MKTSTYLIIAAFIAGIVAVVTFLAMVLFTGESRDNENVMLTEGTVVRQLPQFSTVSVTVYPRGEKYFLTKFRGIEIVESDTVSSPLLKIGDGLDPMTVARVESDTLFVEINPDLVYNSGNTRYVKFIETSDIHPVALIVPRGMVRSISNVSSALYLTRFISSGLDVDIRSGRLVMNRCSIDTLVSGNRKIEELKLTNSIVGVARTTSAPSDLKVVCTDMQSRIGTLEVSAAKKRKCELNLRKANVTTFRWLPEDTTATLSLDVRAAMTANF